MAIQISSVQNPRVKSVLKLNNRRDRDEQQLTIVEGIREIGHALAAGVVPVEAYVCPALMDGDAATAVFQTLLQLEQQQQTTLLEVTEPVFAKMAYRGESGGILLVIPYLPATLAALPLADKPFFVVIEGGEKPGNLGAILRTADAAGVDGVIVCEDTAVKGTDIHNPNAIRASLGAIFTVPTAVAPTAEVITWMRKHNIQIAAATPAADELYTAVALTPPIAIVMGSEAFGLSAAWLHAADKKVAIPMNGRLDSLNLSVATALILYEVVRQCNGHQPRHYLQPG